MSNVPHSVDSALVSDMQGKTNQQAPVQPAVEVSAPNVPRRAEESIENKQQEVVSNSPQEEIVSNSPQEMSNSAPMQQAPQQVTNDAVSAEPAADKTDITSPIDEYGNPIAAPKTYTEDEVQEMIRRRMSRGRYAEQPTQPEIKKAAEDFKSDPNSDESWETQLESFVERTIEKRQAKLSEHQWRAQEAQKQAEFEAKFSAGMGKYGDFTNVVQPMVQQGMLPDSVMLAVRSLENPAAFVYGAAKLYPKELERIARLNDGPSQALEIGRLHERMVKSSKVSSAAPRPLDAPKGDMPPKSLNMPSLEQRIAEHAKQKQVRR